MVPKVMAASDTVREMGPIVSMDHVPRMRPYRLTRPQLGLRPTRPLQLAGPLMEPPVSSPREVAQRKAPAAAAEPLLDPPVYMSRFQGLRALPNRWSEPVMANSDMLVLPRRIAPALFRLAMAVASSVGTKSARMREPPVVRIPLVHIWSFTATGRPCMGPR